MRIVVPASLDILATNVAAAAHPEWSAASTYALGDLVQHAASDSALKHEYESLSADNLNQLPRVGGTEYWLDRGAINRHKMFDDRVNSRTVATANDRTIRVSVRASAAISSVNLLNLRNVAAVTISQTVGGVVKSQDTLELLTSDYDIGLWAYFFGILRERRSCSHDLVGAWSRPDIAIDILPHNPELPVECGHCFLGAAYGIGSTEWGAQPGLLDYSTFEKDDFGDTVFIPRQNVRENNFTVWVDTHDFDRVFGIFERVLGSLVLVDANNTGADFDAMRVFGKITSFRPGLRYNKTPIDIHIEGIA